MKFGSRLAANVAKRSAKFAKWSGITKIRPVRRLGVRVMETIVPSETVTITLRDSIRMQLNPQRDGRWYYFEDEDVWWGSNSDLWIDDELKSGDTFLDIGAHVGYFSLVARDIVEDEGKVIAFEPHPGSYSKLYNNIEMNGFDNVIAEQLAAAEESGRISLYEGDKTIRATIVEGSSEGTQAAEVETVRVDSYFDDVGVTPNVVKINAEGAEHSIVRGMEEVISSSRPTIGVEVHPSHLEEYGSSCAEFLHTLREYGYILSFMNPGDTIVIDDIAEVCDRNDEPFGIIAKHREG